MLRERAAVGQKRGATPAWDKINDLHLRIAKFKNGAEVDEFVRPIGSLLSSETDCKIPEPGARSQRATINPEQRLRSMNLRIS